LTRTTTIVHRRVTLFLSFRSQPNHLQSGIFLRSQSNHLHSSAVRDFPQKPIKPSTTMDFPPGCGRYASPIPPMKPFSVRDFPPRCEKYVFPIPRMSFKVWPKIEKANRVAHMIKEGHSYKGMSTPKQLSSRNIRTKYPLYPSRLVTNSPKLPPSKSLTNAVPKFRKAHTR